MLYQVKYYASFDFNKFSEMKTFISSFEIPKEIPPNEYDISYKLYNSTSEEFSKYTAKIIMSYKNDFDYYSKEQAIEVMDKLVSLDINTLSSYIDITMETSDCLSTESFED